MRTYAFSSLYIYETPNITCFTRSLVSKKIFVLYDAKYNLILNFNIILTQIRLIYLKKFLD